MNLLFLYEPLKNYYYITIILCLYRFIRNAINFYTRNNRTEVTAKHDKLLEFLYTW